MEASGYLGFHSNEFVSDEDAYEYALNKALDEEHKEDFLEKYLKPLLESDEKEKREFVDWFFSGNWVREENYQL